MDNLQEQMPTEINEQVVENKQIVSKQNQNVTLQKDDKLQNKSDLKMEEHFKPERKKTVGVTKKKKSIEKEKETASDEVIEQKEVGMVWNETSGENEREIELEDTSEETEEMEIADDFFDHLNRQEVIETLEDAVGEKDIIKVKKQISLLKIKFLQLNKENREERLQSFLANGGNKEDYDYSSDDLEVRFEKAFERYKANKAKYMEDLEQIKIANLEKKRALLDELKLLIESSTDSLKQIYDKFKDIQGIWKEIGPVPQANVTELWQNYHFYVEKFFDKVKINRELRELDFKKNLERKLEICEKTEALLLEKSIIRSFNLLQKYHQEWKESGPIEEDKKEELWNRFKMASDRINQNRKEYYEQLDKQQEENYKAKLLLCDEMDKLNQTEFTSVKQVSKMGDEVAILFEAWKSLGPAPKEVQNEIWERFRKSLDLFFAEKKQYVSQNKDERANNYNIKLDLCVQVEALLGRTDWAKATKEIAYLHDEWKKTGPVERRLSEALWKRFRKACDNFFRAKKAYYKEINKNEDENLLKKEDLIRRVNEYVFVGSKEEIFEKLKAFQQEWMTIGNPPIADRNRTLETFYSTINKRFNELRAIPNELNKTKYTEYVQKMSKTKNDRGTLAKEQWLLQTKIREMTNDIYLWENNLGFFANSKNSDELRAQFNKKIEDTKHEVEILKAKLAIIKAKAR